MKFLAYQKRWILDESTFKLYRKSRRVGITYATSYRSSMKCLRSGKKDSHFKQWVSSRDDMTACEFITDYVAHWAKEANRIARELAAGKKLFKITDPRTGAEFDELDTAGAENYVDGWEGVIGLDGKNVEVIDVEKGITAHVVRFKNGARIISLSSNPRAFAGKGGDVLIDEWDLHENQGTMLDMAFPCTIQGDQLEIVSAFDPEGSEHTEFAKLCAACENGLRPDISFHSTNILEAVDDGYVEMINEIKRAKGRPTQTREQFIESMRRGCRTRDAFNSQFMCIPNKASGEQMIAPGDLTAAQRKLDVAWIHCEGMAELEKHTHFFEKSYWAGVFGNDRFAVGWDIAATGDLTAMFVNRLRDSDVPGKPLHEHFMLITMHHCERLSRQRDVLDTMLESSYNVVAAGDKSGIGFGECTELELKYRVSKDETRFLGMNFSSVKLAIGTTMQAAYEQGRQHLSVDMPEIVSDVAGIKKEKTPKTNKLTFVATKNELLEDSHCDIGWADGLAIYAGENLRISGPARAMPAAGEPPKGSRQGFNNPRRFNNDMGETGRRRWR